jgi:uncharacterized protein (DUF1810 family)
MRKNLYTRVSLAELCRGQKQSHWMWFIFPQFAGLGHSAMVQRFAIASRDEAVAYLGHGVLGSRLRECTALVNAVDGRTVREILGSPDDLKFHSSITLFGAVSSDPEFAEAITKFYGGKPDQMTLDHLAGRVHGASLTGNPRARFERSRYRGATARASRRRSWWQRRSSQRKSFPWSGSIAAATCCPTSTST